MLYINRVGQIDRCLEMRYVPKTEAVWSQSNKLLGPDEGFDDRAMESCDGLSTRLRQERTYMPRTTYDIEYNPHMLLVEYMNNVLLHRDQVQVTSELTSWASNKVSDEEEKPPKDKDAKEPFSSSTVVKHVALGHGKTTIIGLSTSLLKHRSPVLNLLLSVQPLSFANC